MIRKYKKLIALSVFLYSNLIYAESPILTPCSGDIWNNCYGEKAYADGAMFKGEWANNKPKKGVGTGKDGIRYVGNFKNDKPDGDGVFFFQSGRPAAVGNWKSGKPSGGVVVYKEDGSIKDQGIFEDGVLIKSQNIQNNYLDKIKKYKEKVDESNQCYALLSLNQRERIKKQSEPTYQFKRCVYENAKEDGGFMAGLSGGGGFFGELIERFLLPIKYRTINYDLDKNIITAEVNWKNELGGYTGWLLSSGNFKQSPLQNYFQIQDIKVGNQKYQCKTPIIAPPSYWGKDAACNNQVSIERFLLSDDL
jgi:hypothetical protein